MTPKKIALLTDSSADLRWDRRPGKTISFLCPLRILCQDGEYLDGVNIGGQDIYQRLHNGELPQTSLPRVEDFSAKLHEIFDLGYDGVIAVMLSSGLSGTYNLARIVAGECAEQGYAMKVFDSVSGALGSGHDGSAAGGGYQKRHGLGRTDGAPGSAADRQHLSPSSPWIRWSIWQKGGRIGKVTAMAGTMLQIKPIITFAPDGQLQSVAKVRGRHQVMRKLVDMAVDRCGEPQAVQSGGGPWRRTGGDGDRAADADRGTAQLATTCGTARSTAPSASTSETACWALPFRCWTDQKAEYQKQTPRLGGVSQRVEKVFSPCVEQEYTVGPAGFRAQSARKPGAFLETGSFYPPPAALRLFPLLGFPAHTLHPQGVCGIRRAAKPLTAALPYRRGEFTTLSTVSDTPPRRGVFLS